MDLGREDRDRLGRLEQDEAGHVSRPSCGQPGHQKATPRGADQQVRRIDRGCLEQRLGVIE